jgi:hypothetical protein
MAANYEEEQIEYREDSPDFYLVLQLAARKINADLWYR